MERKGNSDKAKAEKLLGLVTNIQRYSVNDGPGIRTAVFLKGCFLRCKWCHNVEMITRRNEVWYKSPLCTCCGKCIEVCPESAIQGCKDERVIDRDACFGEECFKCVEICPTHALTPVAQEMTIEAVWKEVQKDEIFYRRGEGGVTLSGGDPLVQHRFAIELLRECQSHSIHTCLDTCGYTNDWDILDQIAKHSDLILFDIKHMNPTKHKWGTGVSNELILKNVRKLAKWAKIRIRIPLIPGFNDSEEELRDIAEFIKSIGVEDVDLLPYHSYAEGKYKMYLRKYEYAEVQPPSEEHLQNVKAMFETYGLQTTIGG